MSSAINKLLVSSPDVCGGRLRIDGTLITVNQIAWWYKQGDSAERIAEKYPHVTLAQVYAALSHYHANQRAIDADLEADESAGLSTFEQEGNIADLLRRIGPLTEKELLLIKLHILEEYGYEEIALKLGEDANRISYDCQRLKAKLRNRAKNLSEHINTRATASSRLETFQKLQRSLGLTPAKAAEWQDAIREARR